jgi:hypothetical protein
MGAGLRGQLGPHAVRPVILAFKPTPEIAPIPRHLMVVSTALAIQQRRKLASSKPVQLVMNFIFTVIEMTHVKM